MSWFTRLFRPKPLSDAQRHRWDAVRDLETGMRIWEDATKIKGEGLRDRRLPKIEEALKYFDEAIEKGIERAGDDSDILSLEEAKDDSQAFRLRGDCLEELGFYFEALEDYNEAIKRKPRKGIAANYHMRSIIKERLCDFEGSITDLKEAIRLSRLDNDDNRFWNKYAQSTGFASQTAFYEMSLPTEAEMSWKTKAYTDKALVEERLKQIRRRPPRAG